MQDNNIQTQKKVILQMNNHVKHAQLWIPRKCNPTQQKQIKCNQRKTKAAKIIDDCLIDTSNHIEFK